MSDCERDEASERDDSGARARGSGKRGARLHPIGMACHFITIPIYYFPPLHNDYYLPSFIL